MPTASEARTSGSRRRCRRRADGVKKKRTIPIFECGFLLLLQASRSFSWPLSAFGTSASASKPPPPPAAVAAVPTRFRFLREDRNYGGAYAYAYRPRRTRRPSSSSSSCLLLVSSSAEATTTTTTPSGPSGPDAGGGTRQPRRPEKRRRRRPPSRPRGRRRDGGRVAASTATAASTASNDVLLGLPQRLRSPDPRTQLDFARNGHAVLRGWLVDDGSNSRKDDDDDARIESEKNNKSGIADATTRAGSAATTKKKRTEAAGTTETIRRLRRELSEYARRRELEAWRQKVHVAASSSSSIAGAAEGNGVAALAAPLATVQECRRELRRLLTGGDGEADAPPLPFLQYFHTRRSLPLVDEVCRLLAEPAAQLLGVESVRAYQDSLFWKRAEDGPTPWHVDARMAPFDTSAILTFWIPLHDVAADGGGLAFCSKTHADYALPYWNGGPESWPDGMLEDRYSETDVVDYMPLAEGDVTVHHGWTMHCADPSSSRSDRMALAVSYVDARAPVRDLNLPQGCGDDEDAWSYRDWIRDVPVGSRDWDHELVPILWPPPQASVSP